MNVPYDTPLLLSPRYPILLSHAIRPRSGPWLVWMIQVGITLRNASKGAQPLPTLILKAFDQQEGGGFGWTSYDTGLWANPFRPEHVKLLSLTHSLAVTGKVLVAALEAYPSFSKGLQYLKVGAAVCLALPVGVPMMKCAVGLCVCVRLPVCLPVDYLRMRGSAIVGLVWYCIAYRSSASVETNHPYGSAYV